MKVILKCYGFTEEQIRIIESSDEINILALTDKNRERINSEIAEKKIMTSLEAVRIYRNGNVDAFILNGAIKYEILRAMVDEFTVYGVCPNDIYIYLPGKSDEFSMKRICKWVDYHYLSYIEYHVADQCNLNCKGCVHFSPLVGGTVFSDFQEVSKDLTRLKEIVPYIGEIHILGGEPLLNKELYRYIKLTRDLYPYSRILIISNGLLIRQMDDKLINSIKYNNVEIAISLYRPMFEHIDATMDFLDENGIKYYCSNPVSDFSYTFDIHGGHANGVRKLHCSCPNLYHGKLAICPPIAYIKYFNQKFNSCISEEEGLIDIYDNELTYDTLIDELHRVRPICDNCLFISKEDTIPMEWGQTKDVSIDDYVWRK